MYFSKLTDARCAEIVENVTMSPLECDDFVFSELWCRLSKGAANLAKSLKIPISAMNVVDDDVTNALILQAIVASCDGNTTFSCGTDLIRVINGNNPHNHLECLREQCRYPLFLLMPAHTAWNDEEVPLLYLLLPLDGIYSLGPKPGAKAIQAWYYTYVYLTSRPNDINLQVPKSVERFLQFMCFAFTVREECPITKAKVREDCLLGYAYDKLYDEAALLSSVSRRLSF